MKTCHFLITGPIRPNIRYVNDLIVNIRNKFNRYNVKIYLCYWDNKDIEQKSIQNVDYLFPENLYLVDVF